MDLRRLTEVEIAELERQIAVERARKTAISTALEQIQELISDFDLSPKDFSSLKWPEVGQNTPPPVEQRLKGATHPDGRYWTGRGRAPNWIHDYGVINHSPGLLEDPEA